MEQQKPPALPGCKLLKVSGVLLIILSVIGVLMGPMSIMGGTAMNSPEMQALLPAGTSAEQLAAASIQSGSIMLVTSIISLAGGIFGVKFCNRANRWRLCLIVGAVLVLQQVVSAGILAFQGAYDLVSVLLNLVLPILFLAGALRNEPQQPAVKPAS